MSERLEAIITATDNASPKFRQVGDSAQRLDQDLERTSSTMSKFSAAGAAMGAVLGSMAGFLSDSARAAAESEEAQARLETSIEATGESYATYADAIQEASDRAVQLAFDDEAAADAISFLTQATGDATTAISDLALAEDIARARKIDLAAAAKIVAAAEQGRYGALARIGIQLDANATREEAIAALQAKYAGQAEAYANTNKAAIERLGIEFENLMERIGASTGSFQQLLMLLPGLSAGFTLAATAAGGFFRALGGGQALSTLLPLLTGPLGLAAAFAGIAVAMEQAQENDSMEDIFKRAADGGVQLQGVIDQLGQSGSPEVFDALAGQDTLNNIHAMYDEMGKLADGVNGDNDILEEMGLTVEEANGRIYDLNELLGGASMSADQFSEAYGSIAEIFANSGPGREAAIADYRQLLHEWATGKTTAEMFMRELNGIADRTDGYNQHAIALAMTQDEATAGTAKWTEEIKNQALAMIGAADAALMYAGAIATGQEQVAKNFHAVEDQVNEAATALDTVFRVAVGNTNAIASSAKSVADWSSGLAVAVEHTDDLGNSLGTWSELDALVDENRLSTEQYNAAMTANTSIQEDALSIQRDILAVQAMQLPVVATATDNLADYWENLRGAGRDAQLFALGMADSATATQALSLAQSYIADQDTFGPLIQQAAELNPYLAQILEEMGLISYNPATGQVTLLGADEANNQMAMLTEAMERLAYAQILIAVGLDHDEADREFEDIFGHAAEWGDTKETAQMSVDIGPALEGTDHITRNLDAYAARHDTSTMDTDTAPAETGINDVTAQLDNYDDNISTATLDVQDNASGAIYAAIGALNELDGRVATSYITTYVQTVGQFIGSGTSPLGGYLGGLMNYDIGGMVRAELGEYGDELLTFANGGMALTRGRGLYDIPAGTHVTPAPATAAKLGTGPSFVFNNYGTIIGVDDMAAWVAEAIAPQFLAVLADTELRRTK